MQQRGGGSGPATPPAVGAASGRLQAALGGGAPIAGMWRFSGWYETGLRACAHAMSGRPNGNSGRNAYVDNQAAGVGRACGRFAGDGVSLLRPPRQAQGRRVRPPEQQPLPAPE
jgi:hypothetical protein